MVVVEALGRLSRGAGAGRMPAARLYLAALLTLALAPAVSAQALTDSQQIDWRQLTIEELLKIEVTTASRRADSIRTTAAAVQVLTRDDLHRAGVRYLAEAFRLADAMYVGRFDGRTWIVNTRGLAINGANKMQVMIDGRSIYSPLFSGIFWDAQDLLLEDIERIEIIRGPGASLWGANAVHGVINVITRRTADTLGTMVRVGSGREERAIVEARHGGRVGARGTYRGYAKFGYRDAQSLQDGSSAEDPMRRGQGGGRYDLQISDAVGLTLQGDWYAGRLGLLDSPDTSIGGGNVLGRWTRSTRRGHLQVQGYFDRVERDVPDQFGERRNTFDVDAQQSLQGGRHAFVFGGGYRRSTDDTDVTPLVFFDPKQRTINLLNVFAQDEIALGRGVFATAGSKLEHNTYSGWEVQPTGRLRWTTARHTLWGAVSRAVRMPTRFDTDIRLTARSPVVLLTGTADFQSEEVVTYEGGFRSQPATQVSYEAAVFHNRYDRLRSQDAVPGGPIQLGNTVEGHINGVEVAATWEPALAVQIHGSYAWLHRSIRRKPGSVDITGGEGNDAPHLVSVRAFVDFAPDLRGGLVTRYVAELPRPIVPAYVEADLTVQWDVVPWAELTFVGQNLLHRRHPEFSSGQPNLEEYDRSIFVTLTLRR